MWWLSWQMQHPASVVNKCCCWALPWASAVFWFNWSSKERYLCWDLIFTSLLVCCYQGGEGKEGVMDERTTDVPSLQYKILYQHVTLSSEFSIQGVTGSHSQSIYELTVPTQPMMWVMWCDVWRLATPPGSMSPTHFEQWCGFFYVPQEQDM